MLSPRVGGGGRVDPGEFKIFTKARVKFPTPGHLENVKSQPYVPRFLPKTGRSHVKFPTPGQNLNDKIPTQGKARWVNFLWVGPLLPHTVKADIVAVLSVT